ncbi:hypothetical protein AsAng_0013550 [Aureispira anguillae]|uniref:Uncharacterized protein n=1 Tax=Aureispira anguillae TaxID=2864201 RepID=A0A916DS82_9BACT|nr:hypothetical protein AsAng_0013550 [Aureispira anguillae]
MVEQNRKVFLKEFDPHLNVVFKLYDFSAQLSWFDGAKNQ